jgi:hypothetical protein
MAANKRDVRKLMLEVVELGKKAEKTLATPDSLQSFLDRCNTNKTSPKLLRDIEAIGAQATNVISVLEKAKEAKEVKPHKAPEFNPMDFLASFTGKAIAAAFVQPQPQKTQKGGKLKKKAVPAALRKQVWNHYIGGPIGETKCPVCRNNTIDKLGFEAGHVVPECAGGTTTLANLRPICGECNRSMGSLNMQEYALRYYGHSV